MKQKYMISKGKNENELVIKEFAELDKGIVSELFEMAYESDKIKAAHKKGKTAVLAAIRTAIFYPTAMCRETVACRPSKSGNRPSRRVPRR